MHYSVLLNETISGLKIKSEGKYIDCTLGYAGHSKEILKHLNNKGFLFAFDQDVNAVNYSEKILSNISSNYKIINDNFVNIKKYINEEVDGIIFDLGVSSPQLDDAKRGFSFHKDAKLDMRMNEKAAPSAYEVVNNYPLEKLIHIFYVYGEEKYSKDIAKAIVKYRENKKIETTLELVSIIQNNVPASYRNKTHPARKVFQAIRIEVNNELDILESSIKDAFSLLKSGGRMCIITFHSLEDRIVKNVFRKLSTDDPLSKNLPIVPIEMKCKAKLVTRKPIVASEEELKENNRSRSAKLRIIEKL